MVIFLVLFIICFIYATLIFGKNGIIDNNHKICKDMVLFISFMSFCISTLCSITISILIHNTTDILTKTIVSEYDIKLIDNCITTSEKPSVVEYIDEDKTSYFVIICDEETNTYELTELHNCVYIRGFVLKLEKIETFHNKNILTCFPWEDGNKLKKSERYILYLNDDTEISNFNFKII